MKAIFTRILALVVSLAGMRQAATAQTTTTSELVFQNPTLISGNDKEDGAVYLFENVATNVDATIKILRRSSQSVKIVDMDMTSTGWRKAFQPQLGPAGSAGANKTWWVEFETTFYVANTSNQIMLNNFNMTAIDVDGDGDRLQEFVQMSKINAVSYSNITSLTPMSAIALSGSVPALTGANNVGSDLRIMGTRANYGNIDTNARQVMATFNYQDKQVIRFTLGAETGSSSSSAAQRMYSLWFKTFNLTSPGALPVKLTAFQTSLEKKDVQLSWATEAEVDFSHFTVERSADATSFKEIATVFAYGNTTAASNYAFRDKNVGSATGYVYYRLRMNDKNGKFTYSPTRKVSLNGDVQQVVDLYPNPAHDALSMTLPAAWQNKKLAIQIATVSGMIAQSKQILGNSTPILDIQSISKGVYLIKVECEGQAITKSFVKE